MKKPLMFTAVVMVLGSAWAQLSDPFWDARVTIAGQEFDVREEWTSCDSSTDPPFEYLGTLPLDGSQFRFENMVGQIWCEYPMHSSLEMSINYKLFINENYIDQVFCENIPLVPSDNDDYLYSFTTGIWPEIGPVLQVGDEVLIYFLRVYGMLDDPYRGVALEGEYSTTFDVGSAAPIPEPATLGLVGLGALALALRRKIGL